MFGMVEVQYYFLLFFDWNGKLGHPVANQLFVAARPVGFSDTWLAAEEKVTGNDDRMLDAEDKRTGDDDRILDAVKSIHCIVSNPLVVDINHFPIFCFVIYEQVGWDVEVYFSSDILYV
ncbi:hypothetical protein TNCT_111881 [Trichonephila clavata]|uniref:Uncharacterized protein n=1 Tax=Trichonephila clavata TaxID=2740835 RepID=A0A8X6EZW5_TRICU|nr:hypothetical protein TNCT_111881 [Trichonephila clavata]